MEGLHGSTGKERDLNSDGFPTGLDYFLARYYSPAQGRFTSADEFKGGNVDPFTGLDILKPGPVMYADINDPQTLNKYGYVRNSPLRYVDPDGHCATVMNCWVIGDVVVGGISAVTAAAASAVVGFGAFAYGVVTYRGGALSGGSTFGMAAEGGATRMMMNQDAQAQQAQPQQQGQGQQSTPASPDPGKGPQKSKPEQIADTIESGGFKVTQNPKTPNQQGNVTITHPSEPGTRLNVRVETHPIPGSGGKPVPHANVEIVKPGLKNRPRVVSNEHIED